MKFIKHPRTGQQDPMLTLSVFVVIACTVKFIFEGVNFSIAGHIFNFGHVDAMTYGALLTPVLGAHSYMNVKIPSTNKVDNPDET